MWYIQGLNDLSQFDQTEGYLYFLYLQVEPYLRAELSGQNSRSLLGISTYIDYAGAQMAF